MTVIDLARTLPSMLIAQITDLHIRAGSKLAYGIVDTRGYLVRAIAALEDLNPRPDLVLVTGDLVDFGTIEEYEVLRQLIGNLTIPYRLAVGNHDDRDNLRAVFPEHTYLGPPGGFVQYTIDDEPLRILVLDTMVPLSGGGKLCGERLSWLDARLAEDRRPTLIAMHHPPFACGIDHMDAIGLSNAIAFADIVSKYDHVERIICGHVHRDIVMRFAGTIASISPSVAHQVALDLTSGGPSAFRMEPPGYKLHWWSPAGLVSHTAYIGEFAGPYPFFNADGTLIDGTS